MINVDRGSALPARPDFTSRSEELEWLDGPSISAEELAPVLHDLAWFNTAMLGHYPIIRWLGRAARGHHLKRPLFLIDVGCGYGDLLRAIRRWADRRGLPIALLGLDLKGETIRIAQAATDVRERIDFEVVDALRFRPAEPVDLIVNSLLAHHLPDRGLVDLLCWMEATARRGWLIYDLQRHWLPYHLLRFVGTLLRVHPIVIDDGQISIARALSRSEWRERLGAAGLSADAVTMHWFLFRWLIERLH